MGEVVTADFEAERCFFCYRIATKLCDFPTGEIVSTIDFRPHRLSCDRLICDEHATHIAPNTDFCPNCMKKWKDKEADHD